eukprot:1272897-Rhodomonas_salina.2
MRCTDPAIAIAVTCSVPCAVTCSVPCALLPPRCAVLTSRMAVLRAIRGTEAAYGSRMRFAVVTHGVRGSQQHEEACALNPDAITKAEVHSFPTLSMCSIW